MNRFILIPVLLVGVLTALTYDDYDLEIGVLSVSIFLLFFIFFHLDKFKKKQEEAKAKELQMAADNNNFKMVWKFVNRRRKIRKVRITL